MKNIKKFNITRFSPCYEGREYYESKASFEKAWNDCKRGDWMLWIAAKLEIDRKLIVKAAALCANTVRHLMEDKRSTDAVDACFRYAAGEIGESEMIEYARAAAYADSSSATYASAAADAAADAAAAAARAYYSSASAACAADEAADAADYAADTADTADYTANLRQTANICLEVLTQAVMEKVNILESNND
jgi:hypothetical protein